MRLENNCETEIDLLNFFGLKIDPKAKTTKDNNPPRLKKNKSIENKEEVVHKLINYFEKS